MQRTVGLVGIAAGAVHLFVLPYGHVTAVRSLSFAILVPCAALLWYRSADRRLPLLAAFALWLGVACLSLAWTRDFDASIAAIRGEVLRSFAVFLSFFVLGREFPAFRVWVAASAASFAVLSVLAAFSQAYHGEWVSHYLPSLGDFVSGALTVMPSLAAALLAGWLDGRRERWLAGLILFAFAGSLAAGYLTRSRAFWLVLACGALIAAALYMWRMRRISAVPLVAATFTVAAALALAASVASQRGINLGSLEHRSVIHSAVIAKIAANPWQGTGYGHETDRAWYQAAMPQGSSVFHPHNLVLSYADQMGLLGLAVLGMLFGSLTAVFWRPFRRGDQRQSTLALFGLALLAMVFVRNNLDAYFVKQNLWLFFAHAGLLLGEIRSNAAQAPDSAAATPDASETKRAPAASILR